MKHHLKRDVLPVRILPLRIGEPSNVYRELRHSRR
jgi:hypothetical protein